MTEEAKGSAQQKEYDGGEEEEFSDAFADFPYYDCEEEFSDDAFEGDPGSIEFVEPFLDDRIVAEASLRRRRRSINSSSVSVSSESSGFEFPDCKKEPQKISENEKSHFPESNNASQGPENAVHSVNNSRSDVAEATEDSGDSVVTIRQDERAIEEVDTSLIFLLGGLLVKAITLQIHYFVKIALFPLRSMFTLCSFIFDPFSFLERCKEYLVQILSRLCVLAFGYASSSVRKWLTEHKEILKFSLKCGWGLLWAAYVCGVLVILLVSAFVVGGILVNLVVEEPLRMKSGLNFDYTQKSPVAFVPIVAKHKLNHDIYDVQKVRIKENSPRVIPPHHKLQATVSLTLPESVYNHNLGIFQVRVDFLDDGGNSLASSRRPCMLLYRSQLIHLLLTFLKLAPILTGYTSETQTLKINFKGFVEGDVPTAGIRVVMEQRAEYLPGAGIPEIYDAALSLESELPLLRKAIWLWKKTLFVWFSLTLFILELVFALICCKPVVIPRIRLGRAVDRDTLHDGS